MANPRTLIFSEGDRLEELSVEYVDEDEQPIDVSIPGSFSSIRLHVTLENGLPLQDDSLNKYIDATIDDGPGGLFHFVWPSAGLPEGNHEAVIRFTQPDAKVLTIPATKQALLLCVGGK